MRSENWLDLVSFACALPMRSFSQDYDRKVPLLCQFYGSATMCVSVYANICIYVYKLLQCIMYMDVYIYVYMYMHSIETCGCFIFFANHKKVENESD